MATMKALAWLESVLQEVLERPQWLLSPKRVHPLRVAAAIERELEYGVLPVGDRVVAPDRFSVRLHPEDWQQLAPVIRTLEREMAQFVSRAATERRLVLQSSPVVTFKTDATVKTGDVQVEATYDESAGQGFQTTVMPVRPSVSGLTERIEWPVPAAPAPGMAGAAMLELLGPADRVVRSLPLNGVPITIGRRSGNDLALVDIEVSREHARIEFAPPRYVVNDLGSTNGTRVNGRAVGGPHALRDGDVIELGRQRLRFRQQT